MIKKFTTTWIRLDQLLPEQKTRTVFTNGEWFCEGKISQEAKQFDGSYFNVDDPFVYYLYPDDTTHARSVDSKSIWWCYLKDFNDQLTKD